MNINYIPCGFLCFDIRPLLSIVFPIIGFILLVVYLILLIKRLREGQKSITKLYLIILIVIVLLFVFLSYKITFSNIDEVEYKNKYDAYIFLHDKMHMCFLYGYYYNRGVPDCYRFWINKFKSPYFCNSEKGYQSYDFCIQEVVLLNKNYKICNNIDEYHKYERCVQPYISVTNDSKACDILNVNSEDYKNCVISFRVMDESTCSKFNLTDEQCYIQIAVKYNWIPYCYKLLNLELKNHCLNNLAINFNNFSYCNKISVIKSKDSCFLNFINKNNPSDCELYNITKDLCYYNHVIWNSAHNYTYCFKIQSTKNRNLCLFYAALGVDNESICLLMDIQGNFTSDYHVATQSLCIDIFKHKNDSTIEPPRQIGHVSSWAAYGRIDYKYD